MTPYCEDLIMSMKCKLMLVDSVVSGSAVAETIVLLQKHKNKAK
jgi:hypothetical protein